jgi:hypothetical protein
MPDVLPFASPVRPVLEKTGAKREPSVVLSRAVRATVNPMSNPPRINGVEMRRTETIGGFTSDSWELSGVRVDRDKINPCYAQYSWRIRIEGNTVSTGEVAIPEARDEDAARVECEIQIESAITRIRAEARRLGT